MKINVKLCVYFLGILTLEFIALYTVKLFSEKKKKGEGDDKTLLIVSIICYALTPILLYKMLEIGEGIAITNILWNIASTIYGLTIGMLLFKEKIEYLQMIGGLLGVLGIGLIIYGNKSTN